MEYYPRGKTALITGGTQGLGLLLAKKFIDLGIETVITSRHISDLEQVKKELNSDLLHILEWDVSNFSVFDEKFSQCIELLHSPLEILINNAGVFKHESIKKLLNISPDYWDFVMNVNLKGSFFLMQHTIKHMLENNIRGNVINISSAAAFELPRGPYYISKHALTNITRGWGQFFAPYGIVINSVAPGPMNTRLNNWVEGNPMNFPHSPTGVMSSIEDITNIICFMLSNNCNQMVGETVLVDGGWAHR